MTDLKITTVNQFDSEGVFPLRTIRVNDKSVPTPTAANLPAKHQGEDGDFHPDSRNVNELYKTASGSDLDKAMRDPNGGELNKGLQSQYKKTNDDELNVVFIKYKESSRLAAEHAVYLSDVMSAYSDLIAVPTMPKLVENVDPDNGISDPHYKRFKKSVVTFLNQVDQRHNEKPVMGIIPRLGWEFIDDLLGIYEDYGILAYAFDFQLRKTTTGQQLAMIQPLMQSIAARGIEENVLFYALNPARGGRVGGVNAIPAADIASFGLGFDIIGGRHESPNRPSEVYEQMEEESKTNFRLFDREEWVYRDVPVSQLLEEFPEESGINPQRVVERVKRSPQNAKYRLQQLLNSEQQALAAKDLREELETGEAYSEVRNKMGVTSRTESAYKSVREGFDEERYQTGLGDF